MRAVIYARYSSDSQREASIEDQVRLCRELAAARGWSVGEIYADHALSGASVLRPGYQRLLEDMRGGRFAVVGSTDAPAPGRPAWCRTGRAAARPTRSSAPRR